MIHLDDFDYFLPKDRIAQYPEKQRDYAKLLVMKNHRIQHRLFYQIVHEISEGAVIVANNSKVIPTGLTGFKKTGGKIEILFLREIDHSKKIWDCLLKGRKLKPGVGLSFLNGQLKGKILNWMKFGQFRIQFSSDQPITKLLYKYARISLPPYIKAPQHDLSRYQTIYASIAGSIAAPTAGFHFTRSLIKKLQKKGIHFVTVTLHVGYSTFMPLNDETLSNHTMDPEYFLVPQQTIELLERCQAEHREIIVVGTTTLKALESAVDVSGNFSKSEGWSDLFIVPGYSFKTKISCLITNFHMPKSSPLLMVCAFAGKERIFRAYQEALANNYRFYSFGDAMLININ